MKIKSETLGMRLRRAREFNRLSQKEVEEKTGISNVNISRYETDQTSPGLDTLKLLADTYGVSLDWIFGVTDKPDRVIPEELKEIGYEWVSVIRECRSSGLSPDHIKKIIQAVAGKEPR
jgi:transcriptional regulator with XRE-family HTH domain